MPEQALVYEDATNPKAHKVYAWKVHDGTYQVQCKDCPWTYHGLDDEVRAEEAATRHMEGKKRCR